MKKLLVVLSLGVVLVADITFGQALAGDASNRPGIRAAMTTPLGVAMSGVAKSSPPKLACYDQGSSCKSNSDCCAGACSPRGKCGR